MAGRLSRLFPRPGEITTQPVGGFQPMPLPEGFVPGPFVDPEPRMMPTITGPVNPGMVPNKPGAPIGDPQPGQLDPNAPIAGLPNAVMEPSPQPGPTMSWARREDDGSYASGSAPMPAPPGAPGNAWMSQWQGGRPMTLGGMLGGLGGAYGAQPGQATGGLVRSGPQPQSDIGRRRPAATSPYPSGNWQGSLGQMATFLR